MVITRHSTLVISILAVAAAFLVGCSGSVSVTADQDGKWSIEGTVSWEDGLSQTSAQSVYETREVDPNLLANDSSYPHSGTLTLTLNDGSTVSYTQSLYYDSSTVVSPVTAGNVALVYRPVDPAALQDFLDRYDGQVASAYTQTDVGLLDVSGEATSTAVDVQAFANSDRTYVGTGSLTTTSGEPFQKDF